MNIIRNKRRTPNAKDRAKRCVHTSGVAHNAPLDVQTYERLTIIPQRDAYASQTCFARQQGRHVGIVTDHSVCLTTEYIKHCQTRAYQYDLPMPKVTKQQRHTLRKQQQRHNRHNGIPVVTSLQTQRKGKLTT